MRSQDAVSGGGAAVTQAGEIRSARIESLRALAALGVVVAHAWGAANGYLPQATQGTYFDRVIFGGGLGVLLFFALSGYLLFWPFAKRYWGDGKPIDLGRYALNRVLRIMPLYYVVVVVVLLFHGSLSTMLDDPGAKDWLLHLTWSENFSRDTVATSPNAMNGVVWSVVVELHFYLLLPLLAWVLAKLVGRLAVARRGDPGRPGAGELPVPLVHLLQQRPAHAGPPGGLQPADPVLDHQHVLLLLRRDEPVLPAARLGAERPAPDPRIPRSAGRRCGSWPRSGSG